MLKKLAEEKVFRDPLYGYIKIEYQIILELIDSSEFQRLRRIRQLGGNSIVFHTAEHSRFSHSLGAYELARRVIKDVSDVRLALSDYEQLLLMLSALLHDIGHGPFSHIFETVLNFDHENKGIEIILSETTGINKVLNKYKKSLAQDVAGIIGKKGVFPLVESLISSQLDIDRLDYMERDYYNSGAVYGHIDVERIIRVMKVHNQQICFKESGVRAIEHYLMSRYQMYFQVYYHQASRSYELIIVHLFKRYVDLLNKDYKFKTNHQVLMKLVNNMSLEAFLKTDDCRILTIFADFCEEDDDILKNLADALLNRKLFACLEDTAANKNKIEKIKANFSDEERKYYTGYSFVSQTLYKSERFLPGKILILENDKLVPIDKYSKIILSLEASASQTDRKFFYRKNSEIKR
ncbi:MAG: HD domain-containing protein [Erysipelotrichales bacterium]|nr:HD domain-containing protein [Erysipelotrichales bacterium]